MKIAAIIASAAMAFSLGAYAANAAPAMSATPATPAKPATAMTAATPATPATPAKPAQCRDSSGKFAKCPTTPPTKCRDKTTKKFAKCDAPNTEPVPAKATTTSTTPKTAKP